MSVNVHRAIAKGLEPFRVRVPLLGSQWADEYFYLSPESSGTEGRWKTYPYQIAILNWMTSDDIEEVNWQKSRRVGYTKCLLAATGCLIEQKNRNVAIWQPTDGDAKDFVTDEVDTMLRDVPVLGEKLSCAVGARHKHNTNEKKVFNGATLDIKGGKSARNFRRMSKDVAVYDELAAFDPDIDGEGSAVELGDGRLDQAPFPKSIRGSTPKTKNTCQIEAAVESCEHVFSRYVKCPHCGELQKFEFSNLKWDNDDPQTTYYVCKSGCVLHYRDYPGMDAAGRWQTVDGYYYVDEEDRFYNPLDEPIPKPRRIGAKIWAAYSYLRPWSYVVDRWIAASKRAKTGDVSTLKSVINTLLGQTWEEKGEKVAHNQFTGDRLENYHADTGLPNEILYLTLGGDVQGGVNARVEIEVVGWGLEEESWSIDYLVIPGDIDIDGDEVWAHVDDLLRKKFKRKDGVELRISGGMIDAGYLPSKVFRYTKTRERNRIFASKGKSVYSGPFVGKGSWQGEKPNRAIEYALNTDEGKTTHFNRLKIESPGPGYMHFPAHYDDEYFKGLTGEEKRIKRQKGIVKGYEWKKTFERNEPLDCRLENMAAFARNNPNLPAIKMKLDAQAERIVHGLPVGAGRVKSRRVRSRGI